MLKTSLLIPFIAISFLLVPHAVAEDAPPEVVAARSSAKEHNRRVKQARAELEDAIERASRKYTEQVVQAKERLMMDLRRTLRDAAESDRPENLLTISTQIEKLDNQIEDLRSDKKRKPEAAKENESSQFAPYYGRWSITWPNDHNRRFQIDEMGRVTIIHNSSGNGKGSGVGSTYQAKVVKGILAYHDINWTKGDRSDGRLMFLKINPDKTVTVGYSEENLDKHDSLATANERWSTSLNGVFTPLAKDAGELKGNDALEVPEVE